MAVPAGKLVDDDAKFAQTRQDSASGVVNACGPKSPDSHRVVWGLITRPPVSPAGFPPVSRLPAGFFPFVRLPLASLRPTFSGCSLRPLPGSGSPSVSLRVPFPWGKLHVSAAAGRFRRRRSRAAGTKVTSSAATTSPGSRDPPALQMGSGWARWDLATGSPVTSGRRAHDSPRPNRPDRRFTCVTQLIRQRHSAPGRRRHCAAPVGGGHPPVRPPGDRWFCPTVVICLPGSGPLPRTP